MPWCFALRWNRLGSMESEARTVRTAPRRSETAAVVLTHLQTQTLIAEHGALPVKVGKQPTGLLSVHRLEQPVVSWIRCHLLGRAIPDPLERRGATEPDTPEAIKQIERVHGVGSVFAAIAAIGIDPSGGTGRAPRRTQRVRHQPQGAALPLGDCDVAARTRVLQLGHDALSPGGRGSDPTCKSTDQPHRHGTASIPPRLKHHCGMATRSQDRKRVQVRSTPTTLEPPGSRPWPPPCSAQTN